MSGGVVVVLVAALAISLTNVAAPLVYEAGSNPQTIVVLRNLAFVLLCGLWLTARKHGTWPADSARWNSPKRSLPGCRLDKRRLTQTPLMCYNIMFWYLYGSVLGEGGERCS